MSNLDLFVPKKSDNNRQRKVGEEIRMVVGQLFARGDFPPVRDVSSNSFLSYNVHTSVTHVDISADLKNACIFITTFDENQLSHILQFANLQKYFIKKHIAKHLKLRFVPEITIKLDQTLNQANSILEKINTVIANDELKSKLIDIE